jgi:hypothetical protein
MAYGRGIHDDGPVRAGSQLMIVQDNKLVNYAANARLNDDYRNERVHVIGQYMAIEIKSVSYEATLDIDTFMLQGESVTGSLLLPGWQPDGTNNINAGGYFDFAFIDIASKKVIDTAVRFKLNTHNREMPNQALSTRSTSWMGTVIIPGQFSS